MAEDLFIAGSSDKEEKYKTLIPQIKSLVEDEKNLIANLANTSAALQQTFKFLWTGFYIVEDSSLVLGPFQGPIACTRIGFGKGVCGTAWKDKKTIIVPDVEKFPGHIACSSLSRSEIVVTIQEHGDVMMILDIDSEHVNHFDNLDKIYLEEIANILAKKHYFD